MASRYDLSTDIQGSDGLQSTSPHWVLGFARFETPVTYDAAAADPRHKTVSTDLEVAYAERDILVIDNECVGLSVTSSKDSHTMQLQAELKDGGARYLNEIMPGDWVVANIVYSKDEAGRIRGAMEKAQPINGWNDGLKFVGRVTSLRKKVTIDPSTGTPRSTYLLTGTAFSELDSTLMYFPQLGMKDVLPAGMDKFGLLVSKIVHGEGTTEKGGVDINKVIPMAIQAIFGAGAWSRAPVDAKVGPVSPNSRYIIPRTVAKWMECSGATFSDLLRVLVGVQKYFDVSNATNATQDNPWKLFQPDGLKVEDYTYRTSHRLVGTFPFGAIPQGQTSVWSFLSNYMNNPLNEVVVTLRPHRNGSIYPFMVVRQTPFTSEENAFDLWQKLIEETDKEAVKAKKTGKPPLNVDKVHVATSFLELPRWVVPTSILFDADIGRSDQLRVNLVFVSGSGVGAIPSQIQDFARAPPIQDDLDIFRNGVRPYMPSVNCFLRDLVTGPKQWRDLMADIAMGQHLTLNGSMSISGIRAPIAVGDNLEFEGTVYHIENLTHSCRLDPSSGQRSFTTAVSISRGIIDSNPTMLQRRNAQFANTKSGSVEQPQVATTQEK